MKQIIFFVSLVCVAACSRLQDSPQQVSLTQPRLIARAAQPADLLRVNSILAFPVLFDERLRNLEVSRPMFSSEVESALRQELNLKVVAGRSLTDKLGANPKCQPVDCAKSFASDSVLVTRLVSYVPRQGSRVGVDVPASIGFDMSLLRTSDAKEIWSASYFAKDQAVTENLLSLQDRLDEPQGLGWRSEHELLANGLRAALQDLSQRRVAQFSVHSAQ